MPFNSEHAAMALQMFRKRAGLDRTVDRNVSQSWRTRSSRVLAMAMAMDMDMDMVVGVFMNLHAARQASTTTSCGFMRRRLPGRCLRELKRYLNVHIIKCSY